MSDEVTLSREQVRRIDQLAVETYGLSGLVLMENAGRAVTEVVFDSAPERSRVVVLCGGGNNGGDGYVVARHLANAGRNVVIGAAKDPAELTGDAASNARIAARMGLDIQLLTTEPEVNAAQRDWHRASVIVDALLGTGFSSGQVRPPTAWLIDRINRMSGPTIVAVDVPSGLDCDTGAPADPTAKADVTVTLVARKIGFENPLAGEYLGRVLVGDIGVPRTLVAQVRAS